MIGVIKSWMAIGRQEVKVAFLGRERKRRMDLGVWEITGDTERKEELQDTREVTPCDRTQINGLI